jgi:hypothetical protein
MPHSPPFSCYSQRGTSTPDAPEPPDGQRLNTIPQQPVNLAALQAPRAVFDSSRAAGRRRRPLVTLEKVLLRTVLSILTRYLLFINDWDLKGAGVGFPIPWVSIAILVLAAASVLATAWPAHQAAKIRPTAALRIGD